MRWREGSAKSIGSTRFTYQFGPEAFKQKADGHVRGSQGVKVGGVMFGHKSALQAEHQLRFKFVDPGPVGIVVILRQFVQDELEALLHGKRQSIQDHCL